MPAPVYSTPIPTAVVAPAAPQARPIGATAVSAPTLSPAAEKDESGTGFSWLSIVISSLVAVLLTLSWKSIENYQRQKRVRSAFRFEAQFYFEVLQQLHAEFSAIELACAQSPGSGPSIPAYSLFPEFFAELRTRISEFDENLQSIVGNCHFELQSLKIRLEQEKLNAAQLLHQRPISPEDERLRKMRGFITLISNNLTLFKDAAEG